MRLFKRRVALVIGVAKYEHMAELRLCERDALGIAENLESMGFKVTLLIDPTDQGLRDAVAQFRKTANLADIALLYFSGHGLEIGRQNHLLGKDVDMANLAPGVVPGVEFASEFQKLSQVSEQTVGILDTCRNAPPPALAPTRRRKATADDAAEVLAPAGEAEEVPADDAWKDLTEVADAVIFYASASGDPARQGQGQYSYFTGALLDYLDIPGLPLYQMFSKARDDVIKATRKDSNGKPSVPQVPWLENSVGTQPFVLRRRSFIPVLGMLALALLCFFVARCFELWRPLLIPGGVSSVYMGLLFALLVGFAVWRWGGVNARPLLVTTLTGLIWLAVEFLILSGNTGFNTTPGGLRGWLSNWPDLLTATSVATVVMIVVASEVQTLRSWRALLPPFLVLFVGLLLLELEFRNVMPAEALEFWRIEKNFSTTYYESGIWMVVFAVVLGACLQNTPYMRSNKNRRLLHRVMSPEVIWASGAVGFVLGLMAGVSGRPLPAAGQTPAVVESGGLTSAPDWGIFALPLEPPVNWVPGVALALTMTFVMWQVRRRDYVQMGLSMVVLWILVTWLPNAVLIQDPEVVPVLNSATAAQDIRELIIKLTASAVLLGGGALAIASLLDRRMWRVPAWTLCLLASVLAMAPFYLLHLAEGVLPVPSNFDWALLYAVWLGSFAATAAFGLARPRPYDPRQQPAVPLQVLLKQAFVGKT